MKRDLVKKVNDVLEKVDDPHFACVLLISGRNEEDVKEYKEGRVPILNSISVRGDRGHLRSMLTNMLESDTFIRGLLLEIMQDMVIEKLLAKMQ